MRRQYREALVWAAVFVFWVTVAVLQYHYHQRISSGVFAVCGVTLLGVWVCIRRGQKAK